MGTGISLLVLSSGTLRPGHDGSVASLIPLEHSGNKVVLLSAYRMGGLG